MWRPVRVLFIGDEPSSRNVDKDVPFVGTPSYKRLLKWIGELDLDIKDIKLQNCGNIEVSGFEKIVFLGQKSEQSTNLYSYTDDKVFCLDEELVDYIKVIDHPSPRNRNFNDPAYEKKMLKELKKWIYDGN